MLASRFRRTAVFSDKPPERDDECCGRLGVAGSMQINFTMQVFKEGRMFVAHTPQLEVSSCGGSKERAVKNLKEAVRLFLEEAARMGTLDQILQEAGYLRRKSKLE